MIFFKNRKNEAVFVRSLAAHLTLAMAFFTACRLIFFVQNRAFLPQKGSFSEVFGYFIKGWRFDLSAIFWANCGFVLLALLPFSFRKRAFYRQLLKWLFVSVNLVLVGLELGDAAWFRFNLRRTIASDFLLLTNTPQLWGQFLIENWAAVLAFLAIGFGLKKGFEKLDFVEKVVGEDTNDRSKGQTERFLPQFFLFIFGLGLWILGARGGWQTIPLQTSAANRMVSEPRWAPLLSNATLNLLASVQQNFIEKPTWFSESELDAEFSLKKQFKKAENSSRPRLNVITIAMESFGRECQQKGWTPFLDSLERLSFAPKFSYANGLRSHQGNAAIVAGMPALMSNAWVNSPYQNNEIDGIASVLRQNGYATAFFHGSYPGSMQIDRLAASAGYARFFDQTALPDPAFFDGHWGVFDRPFFQFFAREVSKMSEPFCAHFFSLTSHHPYPVEADFLEKYPKMEKVERAVRYSDDALRRFFEKARSEKWFENTLFVVCADHRGPSDNPVFQTSEAKYRIPILFFCPKFLKAEQPEMLVSQIDILPSVMDFLEIETAFSAFGESVFHPTSSPLEGRGADQHRYFFAHENGVFQIMDEKWLLLFDGQKVTQLVDYQQDRNLTENVLSENRADGERLERRIKAVIQRHHEEMILNRLSQKTGAQKGF